MVALSPVRAALLIGLLIAGVLAITASSADAARSCSSIRAGENRYNVTIERGGVSCAKARRVLRAFLQGKGTLHGPVNGPAYRQSWTVRGWSCGSGAGGGGCIRGGSDASNARNYILAEAIY